MIYYCRSIYSHITHPQTTDNDKNTHMHGISDPSSARVNMGCLGHTKALYLGLLDIADV